MDSDRLTLAALVAGMLSRWRAVIRVAVGIAVLSLLLSFVLPPGYESEASFVTTDTGVQLPKSLGDLASQPGVQGIASELGLGGGTDPTTSPAFYAQLLRSRELLTRLVLSRLPDPRGRSPADSADLLSIFGIHEKDHQRGIEIGIKRLKRAMKITFDARTDFVSLTISTPWAPVSAAVANRAVALVSAFNSEQRVSRARARRIFLETRVSDAERDVRTAETALRQFYDQNRLWRSSPGLVVEEQDARRRVDVASDLYLAIRREYESARIDEVNNTPVITVVDRAVPSRRPLWPRRVAIVVAAGFLGAWLGLLWVAGRVMAAHWAEQHPADAAGLGEAVRRTGRELRGLLRRRRGAADPAA
jgi:uncharacterized protein involved in exopolysaccharide biosynthesis